MLPTPKPLEPVKSAEDPSRETSRSPRRRASPSPAACSASPTPRPRRPSCRRQPTCRRFRSFRRCRCSRHSPWCRRSRSWRRRSACRRTSPARFRRRRRSRRHRRSPDASRRPRCRETSRCCMPSAARRVSITNPTEALRASCSSWKGRSGWCHRTRIPAHCGLREDLYERAGGAASHTPPATGSTFFPRRNAAGR